MSPSPPPHLNRTAVVSVVGVGEKRRAKVTSGVQKKTKMAFGDGVISAAAIDQTEYSGVIKGSMKLLVAKHVPV